jgi:hypothetical protein
MHRWEKLFHEILDANGGEMDLKQLLKQTDAKYKKIVRHN